MTKFLVPALLLAAIAAPAIAAPVVTTTTLTAEGIQYVATQTVDGATRKIVGHEVATGRAFALTVANGRGTGFYDNRPVSYALPKRKAAPEIVASR